MSVTGRDWSRKVYRAVSKFTQNQLLGKNRLRRDFNVLTLQPAISFILCWEWEREVRFQARELSDSQFSIKKEFTACVSDLKPFIHIFSPLPPFLFLQEGTLWRASRKDRKERERQQMYNSYKHSLFLGIYGLHHFNSWIYVPLFAVDLLKWHLFSDFYDPLDFRCLHIFWTKGRKE